jgi:hypothetical protein
MAVNGAEYRHWRERAKSGRGPPQAPLRLRRCLEVDGVEYESSKHLLGAPFGGTKLSGFSREGCVGGLPSHTPGLE